MESLSTEKRDWLLVCYHLFTAVLLTGLIKSGNYRGGPCSPGLDLGVFLLTGIVIIILVLVSILKISRSKQNKNFLIINVCALAIWLTFLFLN
jgi:uncharacterized membrane protein